MNEFFWQRMQDWLPFFKLLLTTNIVFLFVLVISLVLGEQSAATRVIIQLALIPILASLLLSTYMIRRLR
ncbi:hypothetical protein [Haloarchaeobius sp. TZWSO28]|uniref:hypothetical protein n=1 Tax=Haloarchaeobius sp. TZWSO28 TaxID=3446119 RepID=UPI003EB80D78